MRANQTKEKNPKSARRKRQRGAALVETSLVLMTLLGMILFILDMGRILLSEQFIAERARVGARNAVVNNWTSTQVANYVVYGSTTAPDANAPGFLGLLPSQVTLTSYADSGINDGRYQVTVTGVTLFTWIPYIAGQYSSPTVTATMPVESLGATN